MILQELCEYYDILSAAPNSNIAKAGYSIAKISYAIVLNDDGMVLSIMDLRDKAEKGNKTSPRLFLVPEQPARTGIKPYFLCDNSKYLTEISYFMEFQKYNMSILQNINSPDSNAIYNFLNNGLPQNIELPEGNFIFMNKDFKPIHENIEIKNTWEQCISQNTDATTGQCLITGRESAIARLHPKIKGVRATQSAGANIVSFNKERPAFASYGKEQSFNAPVGEIAAFKYGTVLNHMLQSNNQKFFLADSTVVFWAQHTSQQYSDIFNTFLNPSAKIGNRNEEETTQDTDQERLIKDVLIAVKSGARLSINDEDLDVDANFCILGLAPNNARISIRFFLKDNFGDFIKKLARHYEDMEIVGARLNYIPIWLLLKATVHKNSKESVSSPLLAGKILTAILTGSLYPPNLLSTIIERIRAEQDIDYIKAAIIKACLIRNYRLMEEITVSLNGNLKDPAYLLGRLFAVLEQAQWKAHGEVNSGIKERFFASAAFSPRRIFPQLIKNAQNHLAKAEKSGWLDKMIGEILADINDFPIQLNLDKQGLFMLGYYHQRQEFFTKKEEN